jgi:hypothetical protein
MATLKTLYVDNRKDWCAWLEKFLIKKKRSGWCIPVNLQENRIRETYLMNKNEKYFLNSHRLAERNKCYYHYQC